MADKVIKPPQDIVYYKGIHRKNLVKHYAKIHGLSVSSFYNTIFNEWQIKYEKEEGKKT